MHQVQQTTTLPSFYVDDTPKSANEAWARLNNDPLMMVRLFIPDRVMMSNGRSRDKSRKPSKRFDRIQFRWNGSKKRLGNLR